ncbi:Putative ribosome biogenesis GTPase RsgA [uncultured Roseburia sp.]|uniref:Small ribosomal subunit biogenesis GTPase RsgA n=1 Tax=Brotonthovivens ammoniilytica TaxID=2981725 RepID=A0ABT2TGR1_9FIRM|nr:ribosome small subunit-dependent GTPase A [Brotonthovivens ammoniilytica]MCU6760769.1 ribosome small subunit-dependent GTPase A [Brotonthovivens ammoniilytica]SCI08678.1 Putative ribosome biogenesis GTPase RsgA [uncultured Roseburia sp.]
MQGKIIKGIAGFYYVHAAESGIYECKAKGIFRKENIKPLVGDDVEFTVISETEKTGNIIRILPRKNTLIRPAAANIDQAVVIFAAVKPKPNFNLLDRFLIMMEYQKIPAVICFNKMDLVKETELVKLKEAYETSGYQLLFVSAKEEEGISEIRQALVGKTSAVAGPSGVGKSSLINLLAPQAEMETGEISEKIQRGRHTTRHAELIFVQEGTYIVDTPGFSSLSVDRFEKEELGAYFPEFARYESGCRFTGCSHISEPDCGVKAALSEGKISRIRYENYVEIFQELKDKKRY